MSDRLDADRWFAGFVDGEGHFALGGNGGGKMIPRLSISVRLDDLAVLEEIRASFGGRIFIEYPTERRRAAQRSARPAARWQASAKRDLARLVRYFDLFPLRAKKARDYALWRRAVSAYCAYGGYAAELAPLREALIAARAYDGPAAEDLSPPQLHLLAERG